MTAHGTRTSFGGLESNAALGEVTALGHRFGPASTFLTIAVDDLHNLNVFQLTFPSVSNNDFLAFMTEPALKSMTNGSTIEGSGNVSIPCSWGHMAKEIIDNPDASAIVYQRLIHNITTIPIGIKPAISSSCNIRTVKTSYRDWSNFFMRIVSGTALATFCTNEMDSRVRLHHHVEIWGGILPEVLETVADCQDLCNKAS